MRTWPPSGSTRSGRGKLQSGTFGSLRVMTRNLLAAIACATVLVGCASGARDEASPSTTWRSNGPTTVPTALPTMVSSTTAPAPLQVSSSAWNAGTITLSDGAQTQDWGIAAAPTDGGPFPVVVLLHGNHPTCPTDTGGGTWPCPPGTEEENHEGLAYLADALAARGFVAIAPGINVQYTLGAGEPMSAVRTAEILDRALASLEAGRLGVPAAKADTSRLVLIGHSVGGQDASLVAGGKTSVERPVKGVVMLQPALNDVAAMPLVDVPAVVVLSECDGDTGLRPGDYIARAVEQTRRSPAAVVVVERANHNFTNANLRPDAFPVAAPACDPGNMLQPDAQRAVLAAMVPELAHAVLGDGAGVGWAGAVFDEPSPSAGVLLGVVPAGEPVAPVPGPGPQPPAALVTGGMALTFCPEGYYTPYAKPGSEPCHRPELSMMVGNPRTIAAKWSAAGASLTLPVTAKPGDVARLRVVPDFADGRLTSPLRLRLSAPGGPSTEVELAVPEVRRTLIDPFTVSFGLAMWSTVTLPLPDGASALRVDVVGPSAGSMQILSLGVQDVL